MFCFHYGVIDSSSDCDLSFLRTSQVFVIHGAHRWACNPSAVLWCVQRRAGNVASRFSATLSASSFLCFLICDCVFLWCSSSFSPTSTDGGRWGGRRWFQVHQKPAGTCCGHGGFPAQRSLCTSASETPQTALESDHHLTLWKLKMVHKLKSAALFFYDWVTYVTKY